MGREPAEVTHLERDQRGRVVTVITTRESEFTEDDRIAILAQRRAENAPRNARGVLLSEAVDPAKKDDWEVPLPLTDFAEATLSRVQKKYQDTYKDVDMRPLLWDVRLRASAVADVADEGQPRQADEG
ncbi:MULTISPECIES: hypothetical protein [unclassified Microbacterium]|uniref:hypothetical protein n=1 Tax=unclassified Microbacterium TaxID=2609290 RepID=UPI00386408A4